MPFLEVDPSIVRPGWTPLIIIILLAAAMTLLLISMRRQMRKIRVPYRHELGGEDGKAVNEVDDASDPGPHTASDVRQGDTGGSSSRGAGGGTSG